jgi:hypothetical protein
VPRRPKKLAGHLSTIQQQQQQQQRQTLHKLRRFRQPFRTSQRKKQEAYDTGSAGGVMGTGKWCLCPLQDLLGLLTFIVFLPVLVSGQGCSICRFGGEIAQPNRSLTIPGFEFVENCAALQELASALPSDTKQCRTIASIGTLCGCDRREDGCRFCAKGSDMPEEFRQTETGFSLPDLGGARATCELAEAYISSKRFDKALCTESQFYADSCGCLPPSTNVTASPRCGFCKDGLDVSYPDKNVGHLLEGLREKLSSVLGDADLNLTCAELDDFFTILDKESVFCQRDVLNPLRGICGCPARAKPCADLVCSLDMYSQENDERFADLMSAFGQPIQLTCEEYRMSLEHYQEDSPTCLVADQYQHICGCNGGVRKYLGADTRVKQAFLAWVPRFSGCLSIIGSIFILRSVLRDRKRRESFYDQLIASMSCFDICSSTAWIMSTLLQPKYEYETVPTDIYGAIGNEQTCKLQGFMLQLGFTGVFYNVALSVYYVLTIRYNVRESRMKKWRWAFHLPPCVVGLGLALAGIPHYQYLFFVCHIPPPPLVQTRRLINIFSVIPILFALTMTSFSMVLIYLHVRKTDRAANKWRYETHLSGAAAASGSSMSRNGAILSSSTARGMSGRRQSTRGRRRTAGGQLSNAVWWQAFFYMVSFAVAWPVYFVANYQTLKEDYPFWIAVVCLNPLQGILNAAVYFRPSIARRLKVWQVKTFSSGGVSQSRGTGSPPISQQPSQPGLKEAVEQPLDDDKVVVEESVPEAPSPDADDSSGAYYDVEADTNHLPKDASLDE